MLESRLYWLQTIQQIEDSCENNIGKGLVVLRMSASGRVNSILNGGRSANDVLESNEIW